MLRAAPVSIISSLLTAVLLAFDLRGQVDHRQLLTWVAAIAVTGVVRWLRWRHFCLIEQRGERLPDLFREVTVTMGIAGLLWLIPAALWSPLVLDHQRVLLALVMVGMMSGAATTLVGIPPAALPFIAILGFGQLRLSMFHDSWVAMVLSLNLGLGGGSRRLPRALKRPPIPT